MHIDCTAVTVNCGQIEKQFLKISYTRIADMRASTVFRLHSCNVCML